MKFKDAKLVRKLFRIGAGQSYAVTLPIDHIRRFDWQERQKVQIEVDEKNQRFIIKDWEK